MSGSLSKKIRNAGYFRTVAKIGGVSSDEAHKLMKELNDIYKVSYATFVERAKKDSGYIEAEKHRIARFHRLQDKYTGRIIDATGMDRAELEKTLKKYWKSDFISAKLFYTSRLYLMTDEEIKQWKQNRVNELDDKVEYVSGLTGWSEEKTREHVAWVKKKYYIKDDYYLTLKPWELTEEELDKVAVNHHSSVLSKKYNKSALKLANKVMFDEAFPEYIKRKFWTNNDTSFEEFLQFTDGLSEVFCKAMDLSSGMGAEIIKIPDTEEEKRKLYDEQMAREVKIYEERIVQHEEMSRMFPSSVNTIRYVNLQTPDGNTHNLWAFVRFGTKSIIDNFHGGGVVAALDINTGEIVTNAGTCTGDRLEKHPVTGITFKGFKVPNWDAVMKLADDAIRHDPEVNYVGWDIAVTPDGAAIVEGNSAPQVGTYQSLFDTKTEGKKYLYEEFL